MQYVIDDISIPHTWHTIEEYLNNTLYIITTHMNTDTPNWYHTLALEIPSGNSTGSSLALALQTELQFAEPDHQFVFFNPATGSRTIRSETVLLFNTLSDYQVVNSTVTEFILWENKLGN